MDAPRGIPLRPFVYSCLLPAVVVLSVVGVSTTAWAQSDSHADRRPLIDRSAFYISIGGSLSSIDFGSQKVIAIGTSTTTNAGGATLAIGYADGPDDASGGTPIDMDALVTFAPSISLGYYRRFAESDRWLWGATFANDYFGVTSHSRAPRLPQVGTFTPVASPSPVPFTGNAVAVSTHTEIVNQAALLPFLGQSFGKGFVYLGGGPTLTLLRSDFRKLVGFADINGNRGNISGAAQDFAESAWVLGGSGKVGATYFLDHGLFVDLHYSYAISRKHTFDFSSTFSHTDAVGITNAGTLVGSSTWRAVTQGFGVKLGRTF